MEAKKVAKAGLIAAAAGAGAYFLLSKRCAPTRQQWAQFLREKVKGAPNGAKVAA
jgi:hypothetical protein